MLLATISSRDFSPPRPPIASTAAMIAICSAARLRKRASCSASTFSSFSSVMISAASLASISLPLGSGAPLPKIPRQVERLCGGRSGVGRGGPKRGNMKKLRLVACLLALPFAFAPAAAEDRPPPKLIVAISVDQFSADLFAQYRQHFTGGLKRLSEGVVFPSGYQAHAATETCPGHSTILTGSRPARTGIIANNWFAQGAARADKNVYCAEDERVPGSSSE